MPPHPGYLNSKYSPSKWSHLAMRTVVALEGSEQLANTSHRIGTPLKDSSSISEKFPIFHYVCLFSNRHMVPFGKP